MAAPHADVPVDPAPAPVDPWTGYDEPPDPYPPTAGFDRPAPHEEVDGWTKARRRHRRQTLTFTAGLVGVLVLGLWPT